MKKILVIEDNAENMYLMKFLLCKNGYQVIEATSGEEGLQRVVEEMPDLILLDIQLPDMDGYETALRIRQSKADGKVPIIAVTSYAMSGDKEKALQAGCNGYIEKPIDPDSFIQSIEVYL